jgi:sugar lactone lactonase YvrE
MNMLFRNMFLFTTCSIFPLIINAQSAIGDWTNHSPYTEIFAVTEGNGRLYAANRYSVFAYLKEDNSIERIDKTNFLSQTNITAMKYNNTANALLVCYESGNIDIIKNNQKINFPFIKTSGIIGDKTINNIHIKDEFAYLATSFGIVKLDVVNEESPDTYIIGPFGNQLKVNDVTTDEIYIYAATQQGVYKALLSSPILNSYQAWSIDTNLLNQSGNYGGIENINGTIFLSYNDGLVDDILYKKNGNNWEVLLSTNTINSLENSQQHLIVSCNGLLISYDQSGSVLNSLYSSGEKYLNPLNAIEDPQGYFWLGDYFYGLVKLFTNNTSEYIKPNGPEKSRSFKLAFSVNRLIVATGSVNRPGGWANKYFTNGVYTRKDQIWYNSTPKEGFTFYYDSTGYDFVSVAIDPQNQDHYFLGSWGGGVFEMSGLNKTKVYSPLNSTLQLNVLYPVPCQVGGMCYDKENNLWMTNSSTNFPLSVRKTNGVWKAFDMLNVFSDIEPLIREIINTSINQKWILTGSAIVVYDNNETIDDESDDKVKKIEANTLGLPVSIVDAIAEDQDGEIWVGTSQGIVVYYSPSDLFSDNPSDGQRVFVEQDGSVQLLLENEHISAIAIDGANRKWIATFSSGVFLMSEDGTQQIQHFTAENSALLSNVVYDIAIDQASGEIYFGTENGIVSYKGDAIKEEKSNNCSNVYPNPVRPDFSGSIAITGLQKDATVKITDVAGNLIFESKSLGGQAIWNGNNFKGERVSTGVYLAICSDSEGSSTCISKILVGK